MRWAVPGRRHVRLAPSSRSRAIAQSHCDRVTAPRHGRSAGARRAGAKKGKASMARLRRPPRSTRGSRPLPDQGVVQAGLCRGGHRGRPRHRPYMMARQVPGPFRARTKRLETCWRRRAGRDEWAGLRPPPLLRRPSPGPPGGQGGRASTSTRSPTRLRGAPVKLDTRGSGDPVARQPPANSPPRPVEGSRTRGGRSRRPRESGHVLASPNRRGLRGGTSRRSRRWKRPRPRPARPRARHLPLVERSPRCDRRLNAWRSAAAARSRWRATCAGRLPASSGSRSQPRDIRFGAPAAARASARQALE